MPVAFLVEFAHQIPVLTGAIEQASHRKLLMEEGVESADVIGDQTEQWAFRNVVLEGRFQDLLEPESFLFLPLRNL